MSDRVLTMEEVVLEVETRLTEMLLPTHLVVLSESHLHSGHQYPTGMYHLKLSVASPKFLGLSLLACHRLVYEVLRDIICRAVHALKIEIIRDET